MGAVGRRTCCFFLKASKSAELAWCLAVRSARMTGRDSWMNLDPDIGDDGCKRVSWVFRV